MLSQIPALKIDSQMKRQINLIERREKCNAFCTALRRLRPEVESISNAKQFSMMRRISTTIVRDMNVLLYSGGDSIVKLQVAVVCTAALWLYMGVGYLYYSFLFIFLLLLSFHRLSLSLSLSHSFNRDTCTPCVCVCANGFEFQVSIFQISNTNFRF